MSTRLIKRTAALPAMAAIVAASALNALPAQAAARDGVCNKGEFCYYYNSGEQGSVSDFTTSVADYGTTQPGCYDFKGAGAGKGKCIKNEAASVWNRSTKTVRVYYNSNYDASHASQDIKPGDKTNLNSSLKNQNASHQFGPFAARRKMSTALYSASGRLTCGFDGYTNTPGRHEGIDFARSIGADVHALVAGKVTYVARGATGSGGLSTIAVYNKSLNATVIYLHTAPRSWVSVGDTISKGQVIAAESWHGVSSSASAHTHVEMRPGKQTHAAISVGDPTLDNPNPTSFWHARGYSIA